MIVSLSTIPPRSKHIDLVISKWLNQTIKPDKIILNVCKEYKRFPNQKIELSDFVIKNVTLNICEDFGPICKIDYAKKYNGLMIVADDDSLPPKDLIEHYCACHAVFPNKMLCLSGRLLDAETYKKCSLVECSKLENISNIDIIRHVTTAFYHSNMIKNISVDKFEYNDDIIISGELQKSGIEKCVVPKTVGCTPTSQHNNNDLWTINQNASYTDDLIKQYIKSKKE